MDGPGALGAGTTSSEAKEPCNPLWLVGGPPLLDRHFEEVKMERAASNFLKYTVRVGELYSAHSTHVCCRNRQREAQYEWHVSPNCKFLGFIGLCHNPNVT